MRQNEFAGILRAIELIHTERAKLAVRGPRFVIVHRLWQPHTICTPGEIIADVRFVRRSKEFSVPLPRRLLLEFDYLARKRHTPQSLSHIIAGLNTDPFVQQHGQYAYGDEVPGIEFSRPAGRQQIMRIRAALGSVFRKAGVHLDPKRVLVAEETEGNEVRYRLNISVEWRHHEL